MRELLFAVVLLTAGVAGCIGSDEAGDLEQANATDEAAEAANATDLGTLPDGSPVPRQANLTGCSEQGGVFPVPQNMVGEVPEGFSLVSMDPAGQTAILAVIGLSCSLNGEEPERELHGFVLVEPPDELAREDADFHAIMLGGFASIERQAQTYQAWGLGGDMVAGNVTVEVLQETPVARGGHVLGTDGGFTVHMYTTVEGEASSASSGGARVFGVADGHVTGAMDVSWTESQGYDTGEAALVFEGGDVPLPQPGGAGVAFHFWGEDYDITFEHVDLPGERG